MPVHGKAASFRAALKSEMTNLDMWSIRVCRSPEEFEDAIAYMEKVASRTISPDGVMHLFKRNEPLPLLVSQSHSHAP
jgi:hypothetical protein